MNIDVNNFLGKCAGACAARFVDVIGHAAAACVALGKTALDRFCENTKQYRCNVKRFQNIVNRVEARNIPPEKLAKKAVKILKKRNPTFACSMNRNPLLLLLNCLPKRLQLWAIRQALR
ncbi:MAG: hypothetical protein J6Q30_02675 [Oscillospiraceae bacterium]|nr:hypothetical protein [Oscillospiraceae bacterium]